MEQDYLDKGNGVKLLARKGRFLLCQFSTLYKKIELREKLSNFEKNMCNWLLVFAEKTYWMQSIHTGKI